MKKRLIAIICTALFSMTSVPVFAGTWKQIERQAFFGNSWYYVKDNGETARSEWIQDNGKWYYLGESTEMVSDMFSNINGNVYGFNKDGSMITATGFYADPRNYGKYYFLDKDHKAVLGFFVYNNTLYYATENHVNSLGSLYKTDGEITQVIYDNKLYNHSKSKKGFMYLSDMGKVVNKDGTPYPLDGKILKGKVVPVYDLAGNKIGEIS